MSDLNAAQQASILFQRADNAWSAELGRLFGKRAGDVRYTKQGKGEPGSVLRATHDEFCRTRDAWYKAIDSL